MFPTAVQKFPRYFEVYIEVFAVFQSSRVFILLFLTEPLQMFRGTQFEKRRSTCTLHFFKWQVTVESVCGIISADAERCGNALNWGANERGEGAAGLQPPKSKLENTDSADTVSRIYLSASVSH